MAATITRDWSHFDGDWGKPTNGRFAVKLDGYLLLGRYDTRAEAQRVVDMYNEADEMNHHDIYSRAD